MPPLIPRSKKLRTALLVVGSLVFVGIVAAVLVAAAGSGDDTTPAKAKAKAEAKQKAAVAKQGSTKLKVGKVAVQNTGFPTALSLPVKRAVMSSTQRYFNYAIQNPLRGGKVDIKYAKEFDPGVRRAATIGDRATLTEATTGPIRGPVTIHAARVRLDGLGDPSGKVTLVAATFAVKVDTAIPSMNATTNAHAPISARFTRCRAVRRVDRRSLMRLSPGLVARWSTSPSPRPNAAR